jgi:hypothetical protein
MNTNIIYDYNFINSATTTQVYTGACTLGRLILLAVTAGTIDIYDATSGTTHPIAHFPVGSVGNSYLFDVTCAFGIRVVTSAADNFTVTFKRT